MATNARVFVSRETPSSLRALRRRPRQPQRSLDDAAREVDASLQVLAAGQTVETTTLGPGTTPLVPETTTLAPETAPLAPGTIALPAQVPTATVAAWQNLLPSLESELGGELREFRKRMLAGRIPPDYANDMIGGRRTGAWAIWRDIRTLEAHDRTAVGRVEFTLYVRRGKDQLAVWEGAGKPDSLRANFSAAVPGAPLNADDVRRGFAAALVRHRLTQ